MIVNHTYRFIFLKTKKTGGTSLEIALSKFCNSNDTITKITDEDEHLRSQLGFQGPSNFDEFLNHSPAKYIKAKIDPKIWNSYFKFSIIRDPVDQIISRYYWDNRKKKTNKFPDINEWIFRNQKKINENFCIYSINGESILDDFILYSDLKNDCNRISNILGLPESLSQLMEEIKTKNNYRKKQCPQLKSDTINLINTLTEDEQFLINGRNK